MFYIDPLYIALLLPGFLLSLWASWKTKSAFNKYSRVRTLQGLTGAQAAQRMLDSAGIHDVRIVATRGFLSDHYNPVNKTLALSESVYGSPSVAAVGVACHEAGHAIQHARHYKPLHLRSALVPTANIGSSLSWILIFGGMFLGMAGLAKIGVILFCGVVAFQLVTLPVEFDASNRAKRLAVETGVVVPQERQGMDRVLNAAAMTYVAAAVTAILTLLYFALRLGLLGGRD